MKEEENTLNMLDSIDYDLDFEKDLEDVRAASVQNYRTNTRTSGYSATVISQPQFDRHSLPGGDLA